MKLIVIVFLIAIIFCFNAVNAQQKIAWTYSTKKLVNNQYEVHMTANPPIGWHIYSQFTPDGGPIPTSFSFSKNALTILVGKVVENGKLIKYYDKNFKVDVKYFEGKADFVQIIKVKGKLKTNLSGEVESMICNDRTCMPPVIEKFNVLLN
jgi:thiol:disulfide interchange protein DsbD